MRTLDLNHKELKQKLQKIDELGYFDIIINNSQYVFDDRYLRINLWSDNSHEYKTKKEFINQMLRSSKKYNKAELNIY